MTTAINLTDLITQAAQQQGVPPNIAIAVATQESGINQGAVGRAGEIGVFQLLPSSFPGQDIGDVYTNVNLGVGYLKQLYGQYGDWNTALAAYNYGPGNVNKVLSGSKSLPSIVANYVASVLGIASGSASAALPDASTDSTDDSQIVGIDPSIIAPVVLVGAGALLLWLAWD